MVELAQPPTQAYRWAAHGGMQCYVHCSKAVKYHKNVSVQDRKRFPSADPIKEKTGSVLMFGYTVRPVLDDATGDCFGQWHNVIQAYCTFH